MQAWFYPCMFAALLSTALADQAPENAIETKVCLILAQESDKFTLNCDLIRSKYSGFISRIFGF